jgi:iron(III) transport system substrate-binding protein
MLWLKGEAAPSAWLDGLRKNASRYRSNGDVLRAVNAGEIEGGVIYHYYWFGDRAGTGENSNRTQLHYFRNQDPGAFVSISGGGVLASSKNKDAAQAFLRWVTGPAGQKILSEGNSYEYAVGIGLAAHPRLEPLARLDAPVVDPSQLDAKKVVELMATAGLL